MIASLPVLIEFSLVAQSAPVPFHLCNYNKSYKSTFEEKKFYSMIAKKSFLKCSKLVLRQVADLPSNPKALVLASLPKGCFIFRVCMTVTIHG